MSYVIVYGGFLEGLGGVVGPFQSEDEADEWGERHLKSAFWATFPLNSPEDEE